jgi:hypothetical protein
MYVNSNISKNGSQGRWFLIAGSFALAASIALRNWPHGNHLHFVTGFLMGLAIVFLIYSATTKTRRIG